ncbi:MAG: hypothetical protein LBO62_06910 [Endomicrobium sp.]|jgi:hypothetical protein|nr:hypothetical protein [Endomicrobium sp.]
MNFKKIMIFSAAMFLSQNLFARRAPTQPNSYDGIAPTARAMAMGGAAAAQMITKDAAYYNSAALAFMSGAHADISAVIMRKSGASPSEVAKIDPSGQGLTSAFLIKDNGAFMWQALSDNTIKVQNPDGSWRQVETYINSLTFASGQKNDYGFSVGLNMTYLYGKIGESSVNSLGEPYSNIGSGNGFALDLSFLVPMGYGTYFGLNLKNLAGFMFWNDYNIEQLPFTIRAGFGYVYKGLAFDIDWDRKFYRFGSLPESAYYMGIEQSLSNFFVFRAGASYDENFDSDPIKYSYGLGFHIKGYELSFASEQYKINDKDFSKYMITFNASVF